MHEQQSFVVASFGRTMEVWRVFELFRRLTKNRKWYNKVLIH